jgi:hypothetical protein
MHKSRGEQVVILIDEYDKPLIDNMSNKEVYAKVKRGLHDFYQVIKGSDEHEKFVLLTGIRSYVGYTQEELESSFKEYIEEVGKNLGLSYEDTIREIKRWYNGYSWDGKIFVYNPFSTLGFFRDKEFANNWVNTGTPTFLIEQMRKNDDLKPFINKEEVGNISLLFQTGYLTIKKKEMKENG